MKRQRFSEEQIVRAVEQSGKAVPEACREQGIAENTYYRWRRKYGGASVPEVRLW
jgi:putative transposase